MDDAPREVPFLLQRRVLAPLLALVTALRVLPFRLFTPGATFASLRDAESLLGSGEPTLGSASALWALLLAAGSWLTGDALAWGKALSLLFAIAGPPLVMLLVEQWTGERALGLLAGLAWAADPWNALWAMSGTETPLSALVPVMVLLLAARAREEGRESPSAAIIAGLAWLVRPEMIGFWLLYVLHAFVAGGGPLRGRAGRLLRSALPGVTILVASGYATHATFGRLLPVTVDTGDALPGLLGDGAPAALRVAQILASTQLLWGLVIAVALIFFARRVSWRQVLDTDERGWLLAGAWVVALAGLHCVQGNTPEARHLLPVMPIVVAAAVGLMARAWQRGGLRRTLVMWLVLAAIAQSMLLDVAWIRPETRKDPHIERGAAWHQGPLLADLQPRAIMSGPDVPQDDSLHGRKPR